MNGCNNCKFQPRRAPLIFDNVCQKGHPSAINSPPCRDFELMSKLNNIEDAIKEFTSSIKEMQQIKTIEYLYIGLLRQGELGLMELPNTNNYRRIEMGRYDWLRDGVKMLNATEIEYPPATKAWGMITHFGIFDSLNGGQFILAGAINKPKMIEEGSIVHFEKLKMEVTLELLNL